MIYRETYKDLSHGTDEESAKEIRKNGFEVRGDVHSWCGKGIYFYDVKKKSWWAAKRKCRELQKEKGKKIKPVVLFADIINVEDNKIFDLRAYQDLCDFEIYVRPLLEGRQFDFVGVEDDKEKIIRLRAMLISFYAYKTGKKLVIGHFRQRPQQKYEHAIEFSDSLDLVFGIETIYCVKDQSIIQNIR